MRPRISGAIPFFALYAFAQDVPPLTVSGQVRDAATTLPVPNAYVTLTPGRGIKFPPEPAPLNCRTGADGRYAITVPGAGLYVLYAEAEGFVAGPDLPHYFGLKTSRTIDVTLRRPADLSGTVVDDTTRRPIAGISVQPLSVRYAEGKRVLTPVGEPAVTSGSGLFFLRGLTPGSYLLELRSPAAEERIEVTPEAPAHEPAPEMAYRRLRWPSDDDGSQPLQLQPGDRLELPAIRLAKGPVYAVYGRLDDPGCQGRGRYALSVASRMGSTYFLRKGIETACAAHFLVRNLAPDLYDVAASAFGAEQTSRARAFALVLITNRSAGTDLVFASPLRLAGQLRLPERFPDPLPPAITAVPVRGLSPVDARAVPGPGGAFHFEVMSGSSYRVQVFGLRPPFYVSGIDYAGRTSREAIFTAGSGAGTEPLLVVVSGDAGSLTGKVTERDDPAPAATVIAVAWPVTTQLDFPVHLTTASGEDGAYALAGVPPGDYRLLAVSRQAWDSELQKPGRLAALAAGAKSVTLRPHAAISVPLTLTHVPLP